MSTAELTVRPATADDVALVSSFAHRTFVATYAADTPPGLAVAEADALFAPGRTSAELADPAVTYRLAERDGVLAGYLMLADVPAPTVVDGRRPLKLARLYVDAAVHRSGVGTALVEEAVRVADAGGHDVLWLTVWERNPRAIAAYVRWGFADVGRIDFVMAGDRQVDRVMVLPVAGR